MLFQINTLVCRQRASISSIIVFCIEKGIFDIGKVKDAIKMDVANGVGLGKNVLFETYYTSLSFSCLCGSSLTQSALANKTGLRM